MERKSDEMDTPSTVEAFKDNLNEYNKHKVTFTGLQVFKIFCSELEMGNFTPNSTVEVYSRLKEIIALERKEFDHSKKKEQRSKELYEIVYGTPKRGAGENVFKEQEKNDALNSYCSVYLQTGDKNAALEEALKYENHFRGLKKFLAENAEKHVAIYKMSNVPASSYQTKIYSLFSDIQSYFKEFIPLLVELGLADDFGDPPEHLLKNIAEKFNGKTEQELFDFVETENKKLLDHS